MVKRTRSDSLESNHSDADLSRLREISAEVSTHTPKYTELEETAEDKVTIMECLLPPHKPLKFQTYNDYESHYQQSHTNRCRECRKNFPTTRFLDLHLSENHDPIVATRRDKGEKTFACFVEGCEKVCGEWKKRRSHLIDKHVFPRNYDFFIVNTGIDGRRSMLRPGIDAQGHRRSSRERSNSSATEATQTTEATSVGSLVEGSKGEEMAAEVIELPVKTKSNPASAGKDSDVGDLTKSMSSLRFVPSSITFGKRKARAGFAKS